MKKLVFASVVALASISLVPASYVQAQGSKITIENPAEYNAYQMANTQTDPAAKAAAYESFLQTYPQSVVKVSVLSDLLDAYQAARNNDKSVDAASRLLQVDPNNMKAMYFTAYLKKMQCSPSNTQACDDAAVVAKKGLVTSKPADTPDADWKNMTTAAYPVFHSAIALDAAVSKKDFKAAQDEYKAELMLYSDDQSKTVGLQDTLLLAQAYSQAGPAQDLVQAIWFYARVWNFAPAQYKAKIEPDMNRLYKKYHGSMDGLDDIKTQAAASTFPSGTVAIAPAKTPAEKIHDIIATTPDLGKLALADKELVLAYGSKEDADKLWSVMKDQTTPVPGIVLEANANQIKVAVTQDAKDAKTADFIVNMKAPLADKDIPEVGSEFKLQPNAELDGVYDTYTAIPATATTAQSAQIVIKEGFIQAKKAAAAPRKPAAGHRAH